MIAEALLQITGMITQHTWMLIIVVVYAAAISLVEDLLPQRWVSEDDFFERDE